MPLRREQGDGGYPVVLSPVPRSLHGGEVAAVCALPDPKAALLADPELADPGDLVPAASGLVVSDFVVSDLVVSDLVVSDPGVADLEVSVPAVADSAIPAAALFPAAEASPSYRLELRDSQYPAVQRASRTAPTPRPSACCSLRHSRSKGSASSPRGSSFCRKHTTGFLAEALLRQMIHDHRLTGVCPDRTSRIGVDLIRLQRHTETNRMLDERRRRTLETLLLLAADPSETGCWNGSDAEILLRDQFTIDELREAGVDAETIRRIASGAPKL